jgi:hypothetical protein
MNVWKGIELLAFPMPTNYTLCTSQEGACVPTYLSDGVDACDLRYWNCIPTLCIDHLRTSLRALWRVLPPVLNIM